MGSTWHVLAECHHPELVCRRKEVAEALMELLTEVEQEGTVPAAWRRMYVTEGTAEGLRWKKPEHWGTDRPAKAGEEANEWYGLFLVSRMVEWNEARVQGDEDHLNEWDEQGRRILGRLGKTAVDGCKGIWKEAGSQTIDGQCQG